MAFKAHIDEAAALYEAGRTLKQVAAHYGVSEATVQSMFALLGVKARRRGPVPKGRLRKRRSAAMLPASPAKVD